MGKGNGRVFTVAVGSKQSYLCPQVDTAGEKLPLKHLLDKVYSGRNKDCQECGVCGAASKATAPAQDIGSIVPLRKMVRPHGCDATREKIIRRVSSGMR